MEGINTWWKGIPGERFWLGLIGRDDEGDALAVPCGAGTDAALRRRPLIGYVRAGDAVFHYDRAQQAIVAWSTARGRVRRTRLVWSTRTSELDLESAAPRPLPSWAIGLEPSTPLESLVRLDEIARVQSAQFPAVRAFEDRVGEPLYYPFAMGDPLHTSLLAGHVFKLPSLFVEWFPALARVATQMEWSAIAAAHPPDRFRARSGQLAPV